MKLSHKLLTILLAGIVVFSSGGISSYASQTTGSNQSKTQTTGGSGSSTATGTAGEDASEEDGENGADIEAEIPEIPVESNEIDGWPEASGQRRVRHRDGGADRHDPLRQEH